MDRVFVDANVLFSAAYRADAGLVRLWKQRGITLVSSAYAVEEARANLDTPERRNRLLQLVQSMEVIAEPAQPPALPTGLQLPAKDQPILQAAIAGQCTHLLTGDIAHFGPYFGKAVSGVTIMTPAAFLQGR